MLSSETVSEEDIVLSKELLLCFQQLARSCFGPSVCTMSMHALCPLSDQVENFGPLTLTSAATFENLNRQLKRSVSGTKGQPNQMLTRFLLSQNTPVPVRSNSVTPLGSAKEITNEMMSNVFVNLSLSPDFYVHRFSF